MLKLPINGSSACLPEARFLTFDSFTSVIPFLWFRALSRLAVCVIFGVAGPPWTMAFCSPTRKPAFISRFSFTVARENWKSVLKEVTLILHCIAYWLIAYTFTTFPGDYQSSDCLGYTNTSKYTCQRQNMLMLNSYSLMRIFISLTASRMQFLHLDTIWE